MTAARPRALRAVRAAIAVATAAAVAAGCTSRTWDTSEIDDTTPTTVRTYPATAEGIRASLVAYMSQRIDDLDQWTANREEAACAAERLLDRFGAERLLEVGYDPNAPTLALTLPVEERTAAVNVLVGCVDFSRGMLEMLSSYLKLPIAEADCMAKGFERLGLDRDLAGSLVDGVETDPFANSNRFGVGVSSLVVECMGEESLHPDAPLSRLPGPDPDAPRAPTTVAPGGEAPSDSLAGVVPGGPLDTTTTTTG